jgi:hypothetical protein
MTMSRKLSPILGDRAFPTGRRTFLMSLAALTTVSLASVNPAAAGALPEDILKGTIIVSESSLPTKWSSPGEYASRLKKLHKSTLFYDKKTGKLQIYYAAFFAQPVNDLEVNFVVFDITNGVANQNQKGKWEAFLGRKGERVLFNSIELDKEDFEMNKKYRFVIQYRGKSLAYSDVTIRGEGPKYSGKVEFSEEEAKQKQ